MEHLWAPWRNTYIAAAPDKSGDLFSRLAAAADDDAEFIFARTKACFAVLNRYPYNAGHAMVVPCRVCDRLDALSPGESADLWALVNRVIAALEAEFSPHGFNVGMNLGSASGAGIPRHLHVHVVPRWQNDANFMTTTAHTRVHPADLPALHARLKARLARDTAGGAPS
jgi:ATP adenylyltransferase